MQLTAQMFCWESEVGVMVDEKQLLGSLNLWILLLELDQTKGKKQSVATVGCR